MPPVEIPIGGYNSGWLGKMLILAPMPSLITGDSKGENLVPPRDATDFGEWFSGLLASPKSTQVTTVFDSSGCPQHLKGVKPSRCFWMHSSHIWHRGPACRPQENGKFEIYGPLAWKNLAQALGRRLQLHRGHPQRVQLLFQRVQALIRDIQLAF